MTAKTPEEMWETIMQGVFNHQNTYKAKSEFLDWAAKREADSSYVINQLDTYG
jgi:hypothetical protein